VAASVPIGRSWENPWWRAPFGYQWKNRQLVPEPNEVPVRRLIFELFVSTNARKPSPGSSTSGAFGHVGGGRWSDTTVERLIQDPVAKGLRRANYSLDWDKKHWVLKPESDWVTIPVEAIVSEELWEECNAILLDRRRNGKPPGPTPRHLLPGSSNASCGTKMYRDFYTRDGKYICEAAEQRSALPISRLSFRSSSKAFSSLRAGSDYLSQSDDVLRSKEETLGTLHKEQTKVRSEMERVYRAYVSEPSLGQWVWARVPALRQSA